jgi:hemerythrin-like metal-binding protein
MSAFLSSKAFDPATTIDALVECDAITEALRQEHNTLHEGLIALKEALTAGANQESLTRILDNFGGFCLAHFESEERYFRDCAYVKMAAHEAAHQQLIERLRNTRMAISTGQLTASDLTTLIDSFNNHVNVFDKPAYVWALWQQFNAEQETPQQIKELCSLDNLGKLSW